MLFLLGSSFGQLSNSFGRKDLDLDFTIIGLGFIHPPSLLEVVGNFYNIVV